LSDVIGNGLEFFFVAGEDTEVDVGHGVFEPSDNSQEIDKAAVTAP
jgi:hypothetical protein